MFRLTLNIIVCVICLICSYKQVGFCFLEKKYFYKLNVQNDLFNTNNINILFEVPKNIFNYTTISYKTCIYMRYSINDEVFLFLKDYLYKLNYKTQFFKNIVSFGYGYNFFTGPVYFSYLKFAPSFYYIKKKHEKSHTRVLIYSSGLYSYQLVNKVYYSQYLTTLTNFNHIVVKIGHAVNFLFKHDIILFKCSYNIIINENKLCDTCPHINKYIALSVSYFL